VSAVPLGGRVASPRLHRDRTTLALYGMYVGWGWFLFSLGPASSLLAADLGVSRGAAGLHGTGLAAGTMVASVVGLRLVRRVGRRTMLGIGGGLLSAGATGIATGGHLGVTLTGAVLAGLGGSLVINGVSPALAEHHHESSASALSEANAVCTGVGVVAPVAVGVLAGSLLGWGAAVALTVPLVLAGLGLVLWSPPAAALGRPAAAPTEPGLARRPLGGVFWLTWVAVVAGVSIEFGTAFLALDLVVTRTGASLAVGTTAVGAFVLGMATGRVAAGRLTLALPPTRVVVVGMLVMVSGWALLWSSTTLAPALLGLLVIGLGVSPLYPVGLSLLISAARGRPDTASIWSGAAAGVASGSAPFVLGAAADAVGTHQAFVLLPVLAAGVVVLLLLAAHRRDAAAVPVGAALS